MDSPVLVPLRHQDVSQALPPDLVVQPVVEVPCDLPDIVAVHPGRVEGEGDEPPEGGAQGNVPHLGPGAADGPGHVVAAVLGPGLLDPGTLAGLPAGAAEDGLIADQGFTATPRVGFDAGRAEDVGAGNPCARKLCHGSTPPPLTE